MATFYSTFPVTQMKPFEIIPYEGPQEPNQTSQHHPSKVPSSGEGPASNTERGNKEDPSLNSDRLDVIDLTCSGRHPYSRRSNVMFVLPWYVD